MKVKKIRDFLRDNALQTCLSPLSKLSYHMKNSGRKSIAWISNVLSCYCANFNSEVFQTVALSNVTFTVES